jgi:transcriptional regulator with PAS, ATPase and Fis domain
VCSSDLAKLIHAWSSRAGKPFMEVNCGALPESLLESLLFGYEKGAFTGASVATPGYFEKAHGGNLFLDEIADMSAKLQSSLLRVLQDHQCLRIGSTEPRLADFRLICATNRSLAGEVSAGRFRDDLFYRINVVRVRLPPLRERAGDVILLATHFIEYFNAKFRKQCGPLTPAAVDVLQSNTWPGNVRELKHCIERAVALHPGGPIDAMHVLPDEIHGRTGANQEGLPTPSMVYEDARADFERNYLAHVLKEAGGNVSEAARLSGIPRQSLYVRMKRWGLVSD